ncbi:NADH-quinone oxidoreductase subunit L [Candidatus Trichorickettsia mobilis]|uniref:NADH-quinone oxidoreductase subunit L n=1 Tax=Candidatus Trichorickettsia mobilis TaxID=1346319 RepID=A0ABZ0UTF0_9RICK|nr:NADH-quinone oxidoreductase subunit L [Candidatus Trichorickettsia mobilis]WPY00248.1 NADH-quinone oxidoreductase subunit L [Candidatus Trichorickettsia mobilis]
MQILAILIVALPLFSGIINGLCCRNISHKNASIIACLLMLTATICACVIFFDVGIKGNIHHVILLRWIELGAFKVNWAIYVDQLTSIMFLVVLGVSTIVHIYSLGYMHDDQHLPKFLCFLSLFTFFMLALVAADNFIQLFFGWEGVGLCSYLLIGYWFHKDSANSAAVKAFITNRVSDCAFILGVVIIIIYTDSADFNNVFAQAKSLSKEFINIAGLQFVVLDVICAILFIGCMGKSAQFGLHVWLPDAMEGPTPVSALIHAATMVTAGVFLLARCSYLFEYSPAILQFIAIIGGITCLFAATIAVTQSDIKKIIAYSTCSQLGYMFVACGVSAYQAGIFHLATHAAFKALLFLCAGNVIHACHEQDIFKMGGLRSKMPITYAYFLIGSLAIIGIFPLAGYYSKDLILESAYEVGGIGEIVFGLGIIAAILTAIYSMKIIILVFHGYTNLSVEVFAHTHEANGIMNIPLILLAACAICAGAAGEYILDIGKIPGYFLDSIYNLPHDAHGDSVASVIQLLPLLVGIIGIVVGVYIYKNKLFVAIAEQFSFVNRILQNKYYVDELYDYALIKTINCLARIAAIFDSRVIDCGGPGAVAKLTNGCGWVVSKLQTGYIFNYAFVIILTITVCVTFFVINFIQVL